MAVRNENVPPAVDFRQPISSAKRLPPVDHLVNGNAALAFGGKQAARCRRSERNWPVNWVNLEMFVFIYFCIDDYILYRFAKRAKVQWMKLC